MPKIRVKFQQKYSTDDFAAFQLVVGKNKADRHTLGNAMRLRAKLKWIAACDEFQEHYFTPRYPHGRWIDFMRDFNTWEEFHRIVRQENEDEK